ncbi:MAG: tetratricopeptide repeat protein, partial [Anaerolineaceae bacterium]|nr:tetratricopeptide repeat protein [Anaerolineaceae bacterium]
GLFRAVGSRLGEGNTLKAVGEVLSYHHDKVEALKSYEEALGLFRAVGSRLGEANTLQAIGFMQLDTGDGEAGLQKLDQALKLYVGVGDRVGQVNTYWGLGIRSAQKGNFGEAEKSVSRAIEIGKEFLGKHPFLAHMEGILRQICQDMKK